MPKSKFRLKFGTKILAKNEIDISGFDDHRVLGRALVAAAADEHCASFRVLCDTTLGVVG